MAVIATMIMEMEVTVTDMPRSTTMDTATLMVNVGVTIMITMENLSSLTLNLKMMRRTKAPQNLVFLLKLKITMGHVEDMDTTTTTLMTMSTRTRK